MRFSEKHLRRAMRRAGDWVGASEAAHLCRHRTRTILVVLAALLLYANTFLASLTVDLGAPIEPISESEIQTLAQDRSPAVVHASTRRSRAPLTRALEAAPVADSGPADATLTAAPAGAVGAPGFELPVPLLLRSGLALKAPQERIILEGEFAVLLAGMLQVRPPREGWSPASAAALLATLRLRGETAGGLTPAGGWSLSRPLTEGVLASLLSGLGLHVTSRNPDREVSVEEAEGVIARLAGLFRAIAPATYASASFPPSHPGWNGLGNPRRPTSPFLP